MEQDFFLDKASGIGLEESLDIFKTLINDNTHLIISYVCNCKISFFLLNFTDFCKYLPN